MTTKTLPEIWAMSEDEARAYLEEIRWPSGPACVHCGSVNVVKLQGKATRPGVYKCREKGCRQQFTVTVGTIFHRSHIPLKKWVVAFHLMASSKKGISAHQLYRDLDLGSYQSAWHMAHRIRRAMRQEPLAGLLRGDVQVDESWIGGKPRHQRRGKHHAGRMTRQQWTSKTPVVVLVERDGAARSMPIERVDGDTLKTAIRENVDRSSRILTDENSSYSGIGREFTGGHETVNHLIKEYARAGGVTTNSAESYFALLKRGVHGTFHHVSKHHLGRYCDEFAFRWTHRKVTDGQRATAALSSVDGRRLPYAELIRRERT